MKKKEVHWLVHFIAGKIFALVAIVHFLKIVFGWQLRLGGWLIPVWVSWIATLLAGSLSVLLLITSQKKRKQKN